MPAGLQVRYATRSDAETIAAFNIAMARETEGKALDANLVTQGVKKLFSSPQYGFYAVAEMDGGVVASLMITYEWSDWRNGLFWWVQSLYVLPEYRRKGVFRRMYEWIRQAARQEHNTCGLRLYVEQDNSIAQTAYATLGLTRTSYGVYEEVFAP